jgi:predicted GTPase
LPIRLDEPDAVRGRRVLVVEDGPTTTHGGMPWGAGYVAAYAAGAASIVDPRASAPAAIQAVYAAYPHIGPVLPAMGYSDEQVEALRATINASEADVVVAGTPLDLATLTDVAVPVVRARYGFRELGAPRLESLIEEKLSALGGP